MYDRTDTSAGEVAKLEALGVRLKVAPSMTPRRAFTVCHQKYVVVDAETVILGSANWATTSIPNPGSARWEEGES
jgi:phosphatidylserine/phosphatidylglycerophosphate/cardiolipin synthase-like enzyme